VFYCYKFTFHWYCQSLILCLLTVTLASTSTADVSSLTLEKATKFDGLLYNAGYLYGAAGWDGSLIHQISSDGKITKVGVIPRGPIDMVADQQGNLIITSYGSNSVYRLNTATGEKQKIVTLPHFAGSIMNYKEGEYLVGSGGRLYWINELGDYEVYLKDIDRIDNPTGLVMDEQRNIYVGNLNRSSVFIIRDETKAIIDLAQLPNTGKHNIGKLVIHDGFLYATHLSQQVIYKINAKSGQFTIFAGKVDIKGNEDGELARATLTSPNGLAIDTDNAALWVAEAYGPMNQLRKIALPK